MSYQQKQSLERWTRLWQPAGLSSHWTIALAERWYLILLLLATGLHLVLNAYFPPIDDELYYWTWSKNLAPSYYDHSPMVAYLIRFSTSIFGDNLFGIRFFAAIFSFLILLVLGVLVPRKRVLTLVLFCPLFVFGAIFMTPDHPFLLFWTLYLFWLMHLSSRLSQWSDDPITRVWRKAAAPWPYWTLGGLILGLGLLSKYSMALAPPVAFVALIQRYRSKAFIAGFLLHGIIGLVVASPVLYFNASQNWAPFLYQWNHGMIGGGLSLSSLLNFSASQLLLVGALPFVLLPFILKARKDLGDNPAMHICLYFFVLPFLFFLFQSLRKHVEANWALMAYIAFWPIAQTFLDRSSFGHIWAAVVWVSFLIPIGATLFFIVHINSPIEIIAPKADRYHYFDGRSEIFKKIGAELKGDVPVFSNSYQNVAQLRFAGVNAKLVPNWGRASQYTYENSNPCDHKEILVLSEQALPIELFGGCFSKWHEVTSFPLILRKDLIHSYQLIKYES